MPRAPSEKLKEAEELFLQGMAMVDIAKKLEVSDGTVRSWKNRYGWGSKSKKNKCNVAKKDVENNATLQKKKRGGQPGNKNAKGGSGNPNPKPPPDRTIHGGYKPVFMDALDEEEQALIETVSKDEEELLIEQIQLFSLRERRILQAINKYRNSKEPVTIYGVVRTEAKRTFKDEAEENLYNQMIDEAVAARDRLPGKGYEIETTTTNKDNIVVRLEQELSSVQNKKTKAIEALARVRAEKAKLQNGNDEAVDDWISAVLGGEDNE